MSWIPTRVPSTATGLATQLRYERACIERGALRRWGVTPWMYRALDRVYDILSLAMVVYLLETTSIDPPYVIAFGVFLIGGWEALERVLYHTGKLDSSEYQSRTGGDDGGDS